MGENGRAFGHLAARLIEVAVYFLEAVEPPVEFVEFHPVLAELLVQSIVELPADCGRGEEEDPRAMTVRMERTILKYDQKTTLPAPGLLWQHFPLFENQMRPFQANEMP